MMTNPSPENLDRELQALFDTDELQSVEYSELELEERDNLNHVLATASAKGVALPGKVEDMDVDKFLGISSSREALAEADLLKAEEAAVFSLIGLGLALSTAKLMGSTPQTPDAYVLAQREKNLFLMLDLTDEEYNAEHKERYIAFTDALFSDYLPRINIDDKQRRQDFVAVNQLRAQHEQVEHVKANIVSSVIRAGLAEEYGEHDELLGIITGLQIGANQLISSAENVEELRDNPDQQKLLEAVTLACALGGGLEVYKRLGIADEQQVAELVLRTVNVITYIDSQS